MAEVWNVQTWRGTAACGVWTLRGYDDVCTAICCASQLLVNELSSGPQISLLPHTSSPPPPLNPPSLPSGMTVSVCCQQMSFPPARRCFWWYRRTRGERRPMQRAGSAGAEGELALAVCNIRCVFAKTYARRVFRWLEEEAFMDFQAGLNLTSLNLNTHLNIRTPAARLSQVAGGGVNGLQGGVIGAPRARNPLRRLWLRKLAGRQGVGYGVKVRGTKKLNGA